MKEPSPKKKPAKKKRARREAAPKGPGAPNFAFDVTQRVEIAEDTTISAFLTAQQLDGAGTPAAKPIEGPAAVLKVKGNRKYHIARVLAQGGMGVVCEAQDLSCERVVAMKLLPREPADKEADNKLFVQEARVTSQLEHPNIIPVHELGEDEDDNVFYTMKFVRGVTLTEILMQIRNGRRDIADEYSINNLLTVYQKMCDAIAFAHSRGIIHCDLKPGNVMMGDYGEVLVLDWGLARAIWNSGDGKKDSPSPAPRKVDEKELESAVAEVSTSAIHTDSLGTLKSGSGKIIGTPSFMSPEQARGKSAEADERSDIYSLGAILYSILTLRVPVDGEDVKEVLRKIILGRIIPPSEYNLIKRGETFHLLHLPDGLVPQVLSDIVMKAMATGVAERYQSVKALQADIEAYQNGQIWHLVLDEDFSNPEVVRSRWEILGGEQELREGALRIRGGEPQVLRLKRELPLEVKVEFECWQEGSYLNDVACLINGIPTGSNWDVSISGYAFKYGAYTNSYNVLTRCDRKIWSEPATPLESGKRYHVQVERVGPRLRMLVDNREIFSLVDPEPLTGVSRTALALIGWISDTTYTRVRVYTLGTPWKTDTLDMADRQLQKGHFEAAMNLYREVLDSFPDAERMERANDGYQTAATRREIEKNLPQWRDRLAETWPDVELDLRLDSRGLVLDIPAGELESLEPLRGMPLSFLNCARNHFGSLEPLQGMPLTALYCAANGISDLDPLRGMPLATLDVSVNSVRTLAPLHGMKLAWLNCGDNPLEDALDALFGMPLNWLNCNQCGVSSLEPLRGMPLTMLYCDANEIADLAPLRSMPLQEVSFSANRVETLDALRGLGLNDINCAANRIESLEPLRGMPLSTLKCQCNRIKSLEPLKGMSLSTLMCGGNLLKTVDPFRKCPPKNFWFDCDTISSEELEWLRRAWSRDFRFASYAANAATLLALRRMDRSELRSLAKEFRGRRFLFVPRFARWDEAKRACEELGGHLATIRSREENDFIASLFPFGCSWFWIGLETVDGTPRWVTGEPVLFKAFIDAIQERMEGPKMFRGANWFYDLVPNAYNCFMIEWDD